MGQIMDPRKQSNTMPDVLTWIFRKYEEALRKRNEALGEEADPPFDVAAEMAKHAHLLQFGKALLNQHRPVQLLNHLDNNIGMRVQNESGGEDVAWAPCTGVAMQGDMQAPTVVIPVTGRGT